MLCLRCRNIPLDIFLPPKPTDYAARLHGSLGRYQHYGGDHAITDLESSSALGCHSCGLLLGALEVVEPLWQGKSPYRGSEIALKQRMRLQSENERPPGDSGIILQCLDRGTLYVEHDIGTSFLRWFNHSLYQGSQLSENNQSIGSIVSTNDMVLQRALLATGPTHLRIFPWLKPGYSNAQQLTPPVTSNTMGPFFQRDYLISARRLKRLLLD